MPRNPIDRCEVTWEERYGTTSSGNFPTHKTKDCVESAIDLGTIQAEFPWVGLQDFHYYHFKCPYSNEADVHYVRDIDRTSPTYLSMELVMPIDRTNHVSTGGMMIRHARGSKHGWLCVDPVCSYYVTNTTNYFYI